MRTNKTMRIASIILVAVMLSTCAISGTFAKYVTSSEVTDSARVAKWGVTVAARSDAFADAYASEDDGNTAVAWAETSATYSADRTVKADTQNTKVVAPGTKGTLGTFAISGTPEVDVKVDYTIKFEIGDNWKDSTGAFYCPIVIKVNNQAVTGTDAASLELAVENAIAAALDMAAAADGTAGTYTKNYNANQNLAGVNATDARSVTVTWEWPYETGEGADAIAANDIKDTYLGNQAVAGAAATIAFSIKGTVTQID